ncbi:ribosomal protein L31 [synthetic Mycoplasma mycoides JCVI-syn1.0]|uniref:50S ribosomal protein L31 n=1 Tax=Mycoplasma mycoides subsp. capri TaxID=40477 RepID=A0AB38GE66_MYCMC|nr:50S ribosomal protein L31 [Mycoplasma mycoides]ADH21485.1 ribosomal protein L31 [synthetic Mycoplasma mycoides JCVI-syn1.0]AMW76345.1 L31: ribosomal protein L31 [synthetic bacterium JCVI-Syn3.0]AMW76794.1 L31: ribosomal protein L31 [synthetic bacterium JCVI-Syn2.0]AVX54631.1 50S ribosomal protein L31 [synthetic bacterium JCVI-Syn3A]QWN46322.1 50S ribosomal protein L31 [synthetic bacterium JCVI-Syn3B]
MPKIDIQPKYFDQAKFICTTCASEWVCGTSKSEEVRVDVCSNCHPFYTGAQTYTNVAGRVEQFKSKFAKRDTIKAQAEKQSQAQKAKNKENK